MKTLILTTLMMLSTIAIASSDGESHYCSSEMIDANGSFHPQARIECNDSRYGHCLVEIKLEDGKSDFETAPKEVCDKAARENR